MSGRAPSYSHLVALMDEHGIFEHALFDVPRRGDGYCVDDVARALIVLVREPDQTPELAALAETCLGFLEDAVEVDGRAHNRMAAGGGWTDDPALGDWWGRALWALGVTAVRAPTETARTRALVAFHRAASARSPHGRAMAFATLGAADVLAAHPDDLAACSLLLDGVATIEIPRDDPWGWPEPRLRYANAVLPEALLAAGMAMVSPRIVSRGLGMLRFLVGVETAGGRLSVTGAGGRGPGQTAAQFDQQPIEVAALADACARAFDITDESSWRHAVAASWAWFMGDNDATTPMFDEESGAGFDGLEKDGRNENRGAESTLAALSTYQQARRLGVLETVRSR
ncbi:hypothetical protein EV187_2778 [Agromyces ramosus]|uniref:Glycosyltransferase n=1 Tax=Agromyces ramosus TaxID=33879 RepID=A0A4Q7MCG4_9MICO|nr:glycosyltransferase [Agromyces ramosus]RZS64392.1 hypothetical protein EV187_2778 [Agromyces ramosus]